MLSLWKLNMSFQNYNYFLCLALPLLEVLCVRTLTDMGISQKIFQNLYLIYSSQ